MRKLTACLIAGLVVIMACTSAFAEWKPNRAINMIVGWTAGGTSDTTARALALEMSEYLGVPIQVTNVDGANGGIAGQRVADARPDGYTLFGGTQLHGTWKIMGQAKCSWEDFYPFTAGMGGTTIYVKGDSPYKDLMDLVEAIKKSDKIVITEQPAPAEMALSSPPPSPRLQASPTRSGRFPTRADGTPVVSSSPVRSSLSPSPSAIFPTGLKPVK